MDMAARVMFKNTRMRRLLFKFVMDLQPVFLALLILVIVAVLVLMYKKSRKVNTIAVLTGAAGYLLLYISLITLSIRKPAALPIIMYAIAILLFVMLCGIGIKANLKNPKVHWVMNLHPHAVLNRVLWRWYQSPSGFKPLRVF